MMSLSLVSQVFDVFGPSDAEHFSLGPIYQPTKQENFLDFFVYLEKRQFEFSCQK